MNANKNDFKQQARRLQNENADLRFLNTQVRGLYYRLYNIIIGKLWDQYLTKIKQTEKDSHAKSEKIRKLQEKNLTAVITTPSQSKKT